MRELGIGVERCTRGRGARAKGASVVYLAVRGRLAGVLALADPIKPTTPAALAELRRAGLHIVMATGDSLPTARRVATELGIEDVHAALQPADKLALIEKLQNEGHVVAMAGDGINDAPRWRAPMSASPWAPAPMSPCRARP